MSLDAIRDVIQRSRSTGATRLVLMVIAYHADRATGESYASRRLLATEANVSSSTVHLALEELLAAGEIEILMNGSGRKATTYLICSGSTIESLQPVDKPVDKPVDNSVATRSTDRSDSIHGPVATRSARRSIRNRTEEKNKIEPQPAAATTVDDDSTADAVVVHSPNGQHPTTILQLETSAGRRALRADRLARERYPPAKVGFVEFNRARGRIMDQLDQEAARG